MAPENQERLEVELKYAATDVALAGLATIERLGPAVLGPAATSNELDRYLDTADGRLAAALWACRLRTRGERTIVSLKGPPHSRTEDGVHRRPEVEGPATEDKDPAQWPESPAHAGLEQLAAGSSLVERLALLQQRTEREVRIGSERVGRLSLDRVRVSHTGRDLGAFASVELELSPDDAAEQWLMPLRDALDDLDGLQRDPHTKLEHALALIDHAPA
jgi:inorganic triphosphatase YgiF